MSIAQACLKFFNELNMKEAVTRSGDSKVQGVSMSVNGLVLVGISDSIHRLEER
jgi:hypothetical protein